MAKFNWGLMEDNNHLILRVKLDFFNFGPKFWCKISNYWIIRELIMEDRRPWMGSGQAIIGECEHRESGTG